MWGFLWGFPGFWVLSVQGLIGLSTVFVGLRLRVHEAC